MRVIGTVAHENYARKFSAYLKKQGIESDVEVFFDPVHGQMSYQIWIHDEDRLDEAKVYLEKFEERPSDGEYEAIEEPQENPAPIMYRYGTHLTFFFLSLCTFIFFLIFLQDLPLIGLKEGEPLVPIEASMLYDLPPSFAAISEAVEEKAPVPTIEADMISAEHSSYWKGLYPLALAKLTGTDPSDGLGPLFYRIRQGEVWRLFTPAILHYNLLHIAFNMLWLWALGRPIEQRIGPLRTLLFTLGAGVGTNTLQYLMTGPFFLGYSGIIATMAGFIWMREKIAPWEGYPVTRATLIFLLIFISAILALQILSFFIQIFTGKIFAPNIANTAHIGGALIGLCLGRLSFFAQRGRR